MKLTNMRKKLLATACLCVALFGAGCSSIQPLPNFARTGDTVSIAVRQMEPRFIKKEQAAVTVTDAAQVSYPVRLRHLFRVYSDPTSAYSIRSARKAGWPMGSEPLEIYSNPYQGQWIAVVDLADPISGAAPPLTAGAAKLVFSSPTTSNVSSSLEILPGTGSPNPLHGSYALSMYSPMATLEPMPHVQVSFSGTPAGVLGGGSFTFQYTTADFGAAYTSPWVITTSPDPNIQLISRRQDTGNGISTISVTVLNPHGFKPDNNTYTGLADQMSLLRDLRFAIAWDKSLTNITDANWQGSLQLLSSEIFDLDGNPVTGLTTNVQKVR